MTEQDLKLLTDQEIDKSIDALIGWFKSQDIRPSRAAAMMIKCLAEQMTLHSDGNLDQLKIQIKVVHTLLVAEISGILRKGIRTPARDNER